MATRWDLDDRPASSERADVSFGLGAGFYAALLLAPMVALVVTSFGSSAALSYLGFVFLMGALAVGVGRFGTHNPALAVRIGGRDASWLLAVFPLWWFVVAFGAGDVGFELPGAVVGAAVVAAGLGGSMGLVVVSMSHTRHANAHLVGSTTHTEWAYRWARGRRIIVVAAGAFIGLLSIGGIVLEARTGVTAPIDPLLLAIYVLPVITPIFNRRTIRVTDRGLLVDNGLSKRLRPWSAISGYERIDGALVIRGTAPWRPAIRCDTADIENVDDALAGLAAFVPGART